MSLSASPQNSVGPKPLVILESHEQAVQFMKNDDLHIYDVLPIDYNIRLALKDYNGRILSLSDFFDDDGHRYVLRNTSVKLDEIQRDEEEHFMWVSKRHAIKFYYNYYFMLEYILGRIKKIYSKIHFFIDRLSFVIFKEVSPLREVAISLRIEFEVISEMQFQMTSFGAGFIKLLLCNTANTIICSLYNKQRPVLISSTGYNVLKATRDETDKPIIDIGYLKNYSFKNFLVQMYLVSRAFFRKRSYKYPEARIFLTTSFSGEDNLKNCMQDLMNVRPALTETLKRLGPSYYVSQNAVGFDAMINTVIKADILQCQTVMIPHGTNFTPFDEWSELEEKSIAEFNADNEFDFTFIQSVFFENYVKNHKLTGHFKYGNKIWGKGFRSWNKKESNGNIVNLLYAATSYGGHELRLHNYLVHDELVRDLKAILEIIRDKPVLLTIKLRANVHPALLKNELKPYSNWNIIDNAGEFTQVMQNCDALITFRSTAIEEALYLNKPVIIFDYTGRYRPVPEDAETLFYITKSSISLLPDILAKVRAVDFRAFRKYRVVEEPLFN